MTNKHTLHSGFTLVETLVAVLLLITAIAGPLSIASRGLTTAVVTKDQITAYYLAQDAVEYIRFKRDTACLAGTSPCGSGVWLASVSGCISANGCNADSAQDTVTACTNAACANAAPMRFNNTTHTYNTSGTITPTFNRIIKISGSGDEGKVFVTVSWMDTGGVTRTVSVTENMFNWQ